MIEELGLADVQRLHGDKGLEDDLVADDHFVAHRAQLVERLHDEPGRLAARVVQVDAHGVLLDVGGQLLVHRHVLVALQVQQLYDAAVVDERV